MPTLRNVTEHIPVLGSQIGAKKEIWGRTAEQPVDGWVYAIKGGAQWPSDHYHPHSTELVLLWSGSGKVTLRQAVLNGSWEEWENDPQWANDPREIKIEAHDSVVIPRGALHRFTATAGSTPLVLLVLHTEDPKEQAGDLGTTAPIPDDGPSLKRNLGQTPYSIAEESRRRRAKRNRVWGALAQGPEGEPDHGKSEFHLVQYVFKPSQWNRAHFHPYSVEFVLCREGEGEATVVPSTKGPFSEFDHSKTETVIMKKGDTMIVPKAALHEYWDHTGTTDLYLLAMQTPQPIMHLTEHEIES